VALRVVRLAPQPGSAAQSKALAKALTLQARAGADFAELSRQHSSDEATRIAGGRLAPVSPSELPRELAQQVVSMSPGDVSGPIETNGVIVVLKLEERAPSSLPPFGDVLPQLEQRVQLKKMEAARRTWLDALRKTTHVEVRL
jgi:parvulin-like peptidyl-prolyl isomerase